jgi:hypothetical protein
MKKAFTLVEVVAAAAIASLAGLALLKMNANYSFLFTKLQQTSTISEKVSLVGHHADLKYHRTTKTLYDILNNTYEIENDDFRKYLKEQKFDYHERRVELITFGEEELGEDEAFGEMDTGEDMSAVAPLVQFELMQISIKNRKEQGMILQVRTLNETF